MIVYFIDIVQYYKLYILYMSLIRIIITCVTSSMSLFMLGTLSPVLKYRMLLGNYS